MQNLRSIVFPSAFCLVSTRNFPADLLNTLIDMHKREWLFAILFSTVLATTLLVGFLKTDKLTAQSPGKDQQKLTMVTSSDYPPFQYRDTASGNNELVGFNIDVVKYIIKQLGYGLEVIDTDFHGILSALQARRADFAGTGMVATPERKKNVDFSDIYYETTTIIVAKKGSNLKTPADLIGKRVGVPLGSVQEKKARTFQGVSLILLNKTHEIIEELKSNRLDAGILENTAAYGFLTSHPNLEFHVIPNTELLGLSFAFPKGSKLVGSFNQVLKQMKHNGEMERLNKKWFDTNGKQTISNTNNTNAAASFSFAKIVPSIPYIVRGILVTLQFTAISALFGFTWGTVLSLFKISSIKPLVLFSTAYTSVFRGTPLLLQIAIVYYATPQLTGYNISALLAGVITFTLNSGAYISETIRAGILAVDRGQQEAALSLGVPYQLMMSDIILPQAIKNILPALVNESIALLKDSTLVSVIGVTDLLRRAQIVGAEKYIYFEPLIFAGALYYLMIMILTWSGYA
ncbi:MAG: ABC transporter substrate-binding protein/permease, partial [Brasilonema sp.]